MVDHTYQVLLGRPADPVGRANWVPVVPQQGVPAVARGICGSCEWAGPPPNPNPTGNYFGCPTFAQASRPLPRLLYEPHIRYHCETGGPNAVVAFVDRWVKDCLNDPGCRACLFNPSCPSL